MLVPVSPRLAHEDHLVDAGSLVFPEQLADLVRGAYCAPERQQALVLHPRPEGDRRLGRRLPVESEGSAVLLELGPYIGSPGTVVAEPVEVAEGVAEEMGAVDAAVQRRLLILVAHER